MHYQGDEHMGQATCTRLMTLLVTMLIYVPIGSEVVATDTTEAMIPALRRVILDDGSAVFLDGEDRIVGWSSLDATTQEATPQGLSVPQMSGWPRLTGEVAATPRVADLDGDGSLEVTVSTSDQRLYVIRADGLDLEGWPYHLGVGIQRSPSLVDIDGDGALEIFLASREMIGLSPEGNPLPGWPFLGQGFATPSIDDADGDGTWELAFMERNGRAHLVGVSGVERPGWPVLTDNHNGYSNYGPAIGDLDGDGVSEVAVPVSNSNEPLLVLDLQGSVLPGFPIQDLIGVAEGVSMADVNRDGAMELIAQDKEGLFVVDGHGQALPGFPVHRCLPQQPTVCPFPGGGPPAVADLDGDGRVEIIYATPGGDAYVLVFHDDGTLMDGWPVRVPLFSINSQATVGDVDGDGSPDVVVGGFTTRFFVIGFLYAWHADGTLVAGFPIAIPDSKSILGSSATITDLDQDGDVDLIVGAVTGWGGTSVGRIFAFDLPGAYHATTMEWPTMGHDIRHTARYAPPPRLAAHAGFDREVECSSAQGALVVLDGSHSADKDSTSGTNDDIVAFDWFEHAGTPMERTVGTGETLTTVLGLGTHVLTLRVTDSTGQQETDAVRVTVVDTHPPELSESAFLLWPPNHRLVSIVPEVTDLCGPATFAVEAAASDEPDDAPGHGDGNTAGDIAFEPLVLRAERDGRGPGRTYRVVYRLEDASGNTTNQAVVISVPHDLGGTLDSVLVGLSESTEGTLVQWTEVPGADSYDVVRGEIGRLREFNGSYRLGPLTCIAGGLPGPAAATPEDPEDPPLGDGFFYLVGYHDSTWSGYGTESAAKERFVPPGQDCH